MKRRYSSGNVRWWTASFLFLAWAAFGCGGGGQKPEKCFTDLDCQLGQRCLGGRCQLPSDAGIILCQKIEGCPIGYSCVGGVCESIPEEARPDGGSDDGGQTADDLVDRDSDEDTRDFSYLRFTVAVRRQGSGGPATQCVPNISPEPNRGGQLAVIPGLAGGYTLSGTVLNVNGSGAEVRVNAGREECLPPPVTADAQGGFSFYLPSGAYHLQAVKAGRTVAHDRVNLLANTTRSLSFPTGADLEGGPLIDSGSGIDGITVFATYLGGSDRDLGWLAHSGVQTTTIAEAGMFVIPLPMGYQYDLLGFGQQGGKTFPLQVLYENVNHSTNFSAQVLKIGYKVSGRVLFNSSPVSGGLLRLKHSIDQRLSAETFSGADGTYQLVLRAATWELAVAPSVVAFGQGATAFVKPQLAAYQDLALDIDLSPGEQAVFTGRLTNTGGQPVTDAQVRLLVESQPIGEGSRSSCHPEPIPTDGTGTFRVPCNVLPR